VLRFSAVLACLVRGARDGRRFGPGNPRRVEEATGEYRAEMDEIREFLNEWRLFSVRIEMLSNNLVMNATLPM
jgi:phage/plasmid-associated DNA primase